MNAFQECHVLNRREYITRNRVFFMTIGQNLENVIPTATCTPRIRASNIYKW